MCVCVCVCIESWFLADTEQTCVQPGPDGLEGILIGDVFFREYVVEFDMTGKRPNLGAYADVC